eukprot:758375-Hanusia_phi.AAC.4
MIPQRRMPADGSMWEAILQAKRAIDSASSQVVTETEWSLTTWVEGSLGQRVSGSIRSQLTAPSERGPILLSARAEQLFRTPDSEFTTIAWVHHHRTCISRLNLSF